MPKIWKEFIERGSIGEADSLSDKDEDCCEIKNKRVSNHEPVNKQDYYIGSYIPPDVIETLKNCDSVIIDGIKYDLPDEYLTFADIIDLYSEEKIAKNQPKLQTIKTNINWKSINHFKPKKFLFSARSGPNRELLPKVPDQISYTLENLSGIKNLLLI